MRKVSYVYLLILALLPSCMDSKMPTTEFDLFGTRGVFIVNEGNYLYGNSSLSYYNIDSKDVINDIFTRANGIPLGDVAYSMSIRDGKGYIVVNNSGCIHIIDMNSANLIGSITKLTSPRNIIFLEDNKALVSDLYSRGISVINPTVKSVIKHIATGKSSLPFYRHSTEEMVMVNNEVFTNSWSFDNQIMVIDLDQEKLVDSVEVGIQPLSIALDKNSNLWVINDGGYEGNPIGHENPSLMRINPITRAVEKVYNLPEGAIVGKIAFNSTKDSIYFIANDIYKMSILASEIPATPLIRKNKNNFRTIGVDYILGDIYAADANDYMSEGKVFRYKSSGQPVDTFLVGITPTFFCFN